MKDIRVAKQQISQTIAEILADEVRQGKLEPGDGLPPLRLLSKQFDVSIPTVREALKILEARNIVEFRHGVGVFICENPGLIKEPFGFDFVACDEPLMFCFEARLAFEPFAASLAAQRASEEDLENINMAARNMRQLVTESKPHKEWEFNFHTSIVEASQNPFLVRIQQAVSAYYESTAKHRGLSSRLPGQVEKAARFHELIAEAISNGKSGRASELMQDHLLDSRDDYKELLRRLETR
ncbi:MAG: FadR family transcriptional regulator [Firmicutes bacterium]|nr:FadR family transcriptional regulator [Bacillota bacterium]